MLANIITGAVVVLILGAAIRHIVKAKKAGVRCIGCPDGGSCGCGCSECDSEDK